MFLSNSLTNQQWLLDGSSLAMVWRPMAEQYNVKWIYKGLATINNYYTVAEIQQ
jgi:hypothetical protein